MRSLHFPRDPLRVLVQRVSAASVRVDGALVAQISKGLLLLAGFTRGDDDRVLRRLAAKVVGLRVFEDERGRLQHDVNTVAGELLVVPQFTLYANTRRGRRPDFGAALEPDLASDLFRNFLRELEALCERPVYQGRFGAHMAVESINDGPLTLLVE